MEQGRQAKHPLVSPSLDVVAVFARMMQLPIISYRLEEAAVGIPLGLVTS